MVGALGRGGLPRPPAESAGEGAQLGVLQGCSELTESHIGVFEKLARNLEADRIGHLPERVPLGLQVPVPRCGGASRRDWRSWRPYRFPETARSEAPGAAPRRTGWDFGLIAAGLLCGWTAFHRSLVNPRQPCASRKSTEEDGIGWRFLRLFGFSLGQGGPGCLIG
jgi:hypothetical protein